MTTLKSGCNQYSNKKNGLNVYVECKKGFPVVKNTSVIIRHPWAVQRDQCFHSPFRFSTCVSFVFIHPYHSTTSCIVFSHRKLFSVKKSPPEYFYGATSAAQQPPGEQVPFSHWTKNPLTRTNTWISSLL